MTARRINLETNTVQEVSDEEFFAGIFGHAPRTREQVQAVAVGCVVYFGLQILRVFL